MSVELLLALFGAVAVLCAGFWAVLIFAGRQYDRRLDERFELQEAARKEGRRAWEERFSRVEEKQTTLERNHLELRAELPLHYVRREDYVRNQTVIEAKLDALALRLQHWNKHWNGGQQ